MIYDYDPTNEEHVAAIHRIYAPYVSGEVWRTSWEFTTPDPIALRDRLVEIMSKGYPILVLLDPKAPHALWGYAYATAYRTRDAYRWTCESAIYLCKSVQGKGMGTVLYKALLDRLRSLGYRTVVGCIGVPNEVSVKLHKKCGFTHCGTLPNAGWKNGESLTLATYAIVLDNQQWNAAAPDDKNKKPLDGKTESRNGGILLNPPRPYIRSKF